MMKRTIGVVAGVLVLTVSAGLAETMRPLYSKENKFPELFAFEVGSDFNYRDFDEVIGTTSFGDVTVKENETTITPFVRFGLWENLTAYTRVPYGFIDSDVDGKTDGFRDLSVGLELLAYESSFKFPYVIPYVDVSFPTGDEDEGLGHGDTLATFGSAIGTTVEEVYHFTLDGRYEYDSRAEDGTFAGATAVIWDLSKRFSVLAEAKVREEVVGVDDGVPAFFEGGMCYKPVRALSLSWYGGVAVNTEENGNAGARIAYSF
ncbi:MAG: transporter [Lentisphaerae bacterium]|nr:transporter [Lentisphaerota bacterium]